METANRHLTSRTIDQRLTGTWEFRPEPGEQLRPVRLSLQASKGSVQGELISPLVHTWGSPYEFAFVEGTRDLDSMSIDVYEFIYGKKTKFASLSIRFSEEPQDISYHLPALVMDEIQASVVWQKKAALPKRFALKKIAN